MVNLTRARTINSEFFKLHPISALIVGGTSGIGQSIAFKIARYAPKPVIVISGRDQERGQATVEALREINKEGIYSFEKCDISRLEDTKGLANRLSKDHAAFNLLVLSPSFLSMNQRSLTEDGIDKKLAINYFGRFHLINRMLPMLNAASERGDPVSVLSVFAAAEGKVFKLDDIGLNKDYSLFLAASHASNCNDLMVEELSLRYPKISFKHAHPGIVNTSIGTSLPWYVRYPMKGLLAFGKSAEDAADYLLSGLLSSGGRGGWALLNGSGDAVQPTKFQTPEAREQVWKYSAQITKLES